MIWMDQIDQAMRRGNSPYTGTDLLRWLRSGEASLAVGEKMSASIWWNSPDGPEIAHVGGVWHNSDVQWLYSRMIAECKWRGVSFVEINGRKGWPRFFRMKGIKSCQQAGNSQAQAPLERATLSTLH